MLIYLNQRKKPSLYTIRDLGESQKESKRWDIVPVEKAPPYEIILFSYPYVNNETGEVMLPDKMHRALVLPPSTKIEGSVDNYVHVAKGTSWDYDDDTIPIYAKDVKGDKSFSNGNIKLNAICSIEPGTIIIKLCYLKSPKAEEVKEAIEQFSGMREFMVYHKDGSFSFAGKKYVSPPKPKVPASNSSEKEGNSEPINSSLRYRRSFSPLYEFAVNPNYIKAIIIE